MWDKLTKFDQDATLYVNSRHVFVLDKIMWFVSERVNRPDTRLMVHVLLRIIFRKQRCVRLLSGMALTILCSNYITNFVKRIIKRPRPFATSRIGSSVRIYDNYRLSDCSFFSAHAANSFAVAGYLADHRLLIRCRLAIARGGDTQEVRAQGSRLSV